MTGDRVIDTTSLVMTDSSRAPSRESIVNTAIKFLVNPRVQWTTLDQKQTFLRQKGLSEEEITEACQRANAFEKQDQQISLPLPPRPPPPTAYYSTACDTPTWVKVKDISNVVALLSLGSYSLYALWRSHVAPWLFGRPRKSDKNQVLLTAITSLTDSVTELRALVSRLESTLQRKERSPSRDPEDLRVKEVQALEEVREELSSIKSLLLARAQFPSSPGIPSWQLVEKEGTSREDSRDQSPHPHEEPLKSESCAEVNRVRKESSSGSHESIALHSDGSSCEVVMVSGKQDSDHSDEA